MSKQLDPDRKIEGSYIFTGPMSQKGYALNKLGASLLSDEARDAFKKDEEGYMSKFYLSEEQKKLIRDRNWIGCVQAGSNIYFLYKITTVFGDTLYKLGAKQAGMTYEEFLETAAKSCFGHDGILENPITVIGHARLMTNGNKDFKKKAY